MYKGKTTKKTLKRDECAFYYYIFNSTYNGYIIHQINICLQKKKKSHSALVRGGWMVVSRKLPQLDGC